MKNVEYVNFKKVEENEDVIIKVKLEEEGKKVKRTAKIKNGKDKGEYITYRESNVIFEEFVHNLKESIKENKDYELIEKEEI